MKLLRYLSTSPTQGINPLSKAIVLIEGYIDIGTAKSITCESGICMSDM